MITKYYYNPEKKLMYKRTDYQLQLVILQILGRDLSQPFQHRHERVTYHNEERLQEELAGCSESFAQDWEKLLNEYLQVNKEKLAFMNNHRQKQYEAGLLKL